MRPFVFRAQAALDLRKRKDDEAKRVLAAANAAVAAAEAAFASAAQTHDKALEDARTAAAQATSAFDLVWYRNWITGTQQEMARRQETLAARRTDAQAAREHATRTQIDVRVLEKLRDRARKAYQLAADREEQKAIDWLAVLRSTSQNREREGST